MAMTQRTSLHRPWLVKMLIFLGVLVFFGIYGLYDALQAYPARGARYADYCKFQYLERASADPGGLSRERVSVPSPVEEFSRLLTRGRDRSEIESLKLEWLSALDVIGRLDASRTAIDDPGAELTRLAGEWRASGGGAKSAPKKLAAYDIPVQWVFVAVGLGGGLLLALRLMKVKSTAFTWDPDEKRLGLPGGATLTPGDIAEFDKRRWDKFLIFLKIKPGHERLGDQELKLDLLTHRPLEEWVLEMERIAFPENQEQAPAVEPIVEAPKS